MSVYRSIHINRAQLRRGFVEHRRDTLLEIGRILGRDAYKAFGRQALGARPWAASRVMNRSGAILDLAAGPSIKERRWQSRPSLIDYGDLRKRTVEWPANVRIGGTSAAAKEAGANVVTLVIRHPAARLSQEGGIATTPIYQTAKNNLRQYLKKTRQQRDDAMAKWDIPKAEKLEGRLGMVRRQMGWMLGKRTSFQTRVPARPYLGPTDEALDRIVGLIVRRAKSR